MPGVSDAAGSAPGKPCVSPAPKLEGWMPPLSGLGLRSLRSGDSGGEVAAKCALRNLIALRLLRGSFRHGHVGRRNAGHVTERLAAAMRSSRRYALHALHEFRAGKVAVSGARGRLRGSRGFGIVRVIRLLCQRAKQAGKPCTAEIGRLLLFRREARRGCCRARVGCGKPAGKWTAKGGVDAASVTSWHIYSSFFPTGLLFSRHAVSGGVRFTPAGANCCAGSVLLPVSFSLICAIPGAFFLHASKNHCGTDRC